MKLKLWFVLILLSAGCYSQKYSSIFESSNNGLTKVESIDYNNQDFSDLEFLEEILEDKRVVWFGEGTHFLGSTDSAFVRLVKYLHQELGYTVLLSEFSIWAMWYTTLLLQDSSVSQSVYKALPGFQYNRIPYVNLWEYYKKNRNTPNEINFHGTDIWLESSIVSDTNAPQLDNFLYKSFNYDIRELWAEYRNILCEYVYIRNHYQVSSQLYASFRSIDANLQKHLDTLLTLHPDNKELLLWNQVLKSNRGLFSWIYWRLNNWISKAPTWSNKYSKRIALINEMRDSLMADNALFFINNYYKDEKVMIITSNYHMMNNYLDDKKHLRRTGGINTMGEIVKSELKDELYTIAFIQHGGYHGISGVEQKLPRAPVSSLENYLAKSNYDYAFINFQTLNSEEDFVLNPSGGLGDFYNADWSKVFDGLFFIKDMGPILLDESIPYLKNNTGCK